MAWLIRSVLLWWLPLFYAAAQGIPYGHNPAAGHYYAGRGVRLYYELYGAGPPLLLLHGNGGSLQDFRRTIPYFARKYRVIALDSRAHGKSLDSGDSLSFELLADDCAALLTSLRADSANVLGWSDGGIVALLLAQRHPRHVRRFAATGANLWPDSTAFVPRFWQQQQRAYRQYRDSVFTSPARRNDWKVFRLDVLQPRVPLAALRQLRAPGFIIAGDRDVIAPTHTIAIYQHLARAWLWIVPHCGHATLLEYSAEFNRQVDAFFRAPAIARPEF